MRAAAVVLALAFGLLPARVFAHSGPAFPIATDQRSGPYTVSIWTDPDTTDDGSAAGRFWVVVAAGPASPPAARVSIVATPRNGTGRPTAIDIASPGRDGHTFYGAVVMDHEGPYGIDVRVTGPSGDATIHGDVDATYDLRPSPFVAALYLLPFVLVGAVWMRLLVRRSRVAKAMRAGPPRGGAPVMDGARISPPSSR
jgi:hypothetical protein